MRVVNDREERSNSTEVGLLTLLTHILMTSVGMATIFFSPLPMIQSHMRLQEPWPKIATLAGALTALLIFELPVAVVLLTFIFGLVVADGVRKEAPFWRVLSNALFALLFLSTITLVVYAAMEKVTLSLYWTEWIDKLIASAQKGLQLGSEIDWPSMRNTFLYEGPFLLLAMAILSFWFSVGFAAHAMWLKESSSFSGVALRKLVLPKWLPFLFLGVFLLSQYTKGPTQFFWSGTIRVISVLLFIQGTVVLSNLMSIKQVRPGVKAVLYLVAVSFAFYAVVGIGMIGPWLNVSKLWAKKQIDLPQIEEAV